jgi:hypothetical protein
MKTLRQIARAQIIFWIIMILPLALSSCGGTNQTPSRSFYLGFSPWPYEATQEAVDWVYTKISVAGDAISQHMEDFPQ